MVGDKSDAWVKASTDKVYLAGFTQEHALLGLTPMDELDLHLACENHAIQVVRMNAVNRENDIV